MRTSGAAFAIIGLVMAALSTVTLSMPSRRDLAFSASWGVDVSRVAMDPPTSLFRGVPIAQRSRPQSSRSRGALQALEGRIPFDAAGQALRRIRDKSHPIKSAATTIPATSLDASPGSYPKLSHLIHDLQLLSAPFWQGEKRVQALLWTTGTLFLALFTTVYAVGVSFVQKFFWNALNAKDVPKYNKFLALYFAVVTIGPPLLVLYDWFKSRMSLAWRTALTETYLNNYVNRMKYYKLPLFSRLDNADQRIAEDIRSVTDKAVSLICTTFVSVCDLIVFSYILYKIYPPLYAVLLAYTAAGTVATLLIGRPLTALNREQLRKEADFRYGLVRLRDNGESIAFYNGEDRERREVTGRFRALAGNAVCVLGLERTLGFFTRWYRYLVQVVPAVVIGPRYLNGLVELGSVTQTFVSFNHVLSDLSIIVNEFAGPAGLSAFAAGVARLRELQHALESADGPEPGAPGGARIELTTPAAGGPATLRLEGLTVTTPTAGAAPRRLVESLSLDVQAGRRVLVVGDSGIGKSSLMRAVAGLWDAGAGTVERPPPSETLFLSQRPYITLGTLRENVIYPTPAETSTTTDQEVLSALERVNLGYLSDRLGGINAPSDQLSSILSLGEQQRLAFARLLIARPRFVILDESTSALDLDNERRVYKLLEEIGCTTVSVGNRPSLMQFHDTVLRLLGDGQWKVEEPVAVV